MSVTQLTADEYIESITQDSYDIPQSEGVYDLVDSLEEEYPTGEEDIDHQEGGSFNFERAVKVLNNTVWNFASPGLQDNIEVPETDELAREGDYEELRTHLEEVNL